MNFKKNISSHRNFFSWLAVLAAALFALGAILAVNNIFYKNFLMDVKNLSEPVKIAKPTARLEIDFGNGKKRAFEGEVVEGMTVSDAVVFASQAGKFEIEFSKDRTALTSIAGTANTSSRSWVMYFNGVKQKSVNLPLKGGDKIIFAYEPRVPAVR